MKTQERESSDRKHYPKFHYMSLLDQEQEPDQTETPKSSNRRPDSSARGPEHSFLTNEVSYIAPHLQYRPFHSQNELIELKV